MAVVYFVHSPDVKFQLGAECCFDCDVVAWCVLCHSNGMWCTVTFITLWSCLVVVLWPPFYTCIVCVQSLGLTNVMTLNQ